MVSRAAPALTKIGFRRDVKLFLGLLVGYLVTIVLLLLLLLQTNVDELRNAMMQQWNATADDVAESIRASIERNETAAIRDRLLVLRGRHELAAIRVDMPRGQSIASGFVNDGTENLTRRVPGATITISFDRSPIDAARKRFLYTALICLASVLVCTIFLVQYLPKIVKPIEDLLDHAGVLGERHADEDETRYLVDTFKRSIETLQRQEEELQQLHAREKQRADDLELITVTLTRSLSSGFISIDPEGHIVDVNAAGREILGLDRAADYSAQPLGSLGSPVVIDAIQRAFDARAPLTRAEVSMQRDGAEAIIGLSAVPLFNERNVYLGMIVLFSDLTPVRRLETRLRELDTLASLGEMSAGIAHEFRNSLSTILGYLKLARRSEDAGEIDKRIGSAEEEAAVLARAVDGLLAFARPLAIERSDVDLMQVAKSVAGRLAETAEPIAFRFEGDGLHIDGDAPLLARAIENLYRNSIDAIRAKGNGGGIVVRAAGGASPALEISDDGIGLDPADAARLFLPFQSDKANGLGLGLAITRKIVLLHGGTVRMTGAPGAGATVTLEFPALQKVTTPQMPATDAKPAPSA